MDSIRHFALVLFGAVLAAGIATPGAVPAAEPQQKPEPSREQLLGEARTLRERAARMRHESVARRQSEEADCQRRFLVNACLDETRERHRKVIVEARELEHRAISLERQVRVREHADREAEAERRRAAIAERAAQARQAQEAQERAAEALRAERLRREDERRPKAEPSADSAAEGGK